MVFAERFCFEYRQSIFAISISLLEKGVAPHLNHYNSLYPRLFVLSLVEISPAVLEKKILNIMYVHFFTIICLWKGRGLSFNKLEFTSPKDDVCQGLLKWTENDEQNAIRKAYLSFQLRWAKIYESKMHGKVILLWKVHRHLSPSIEGK